MYLIITFFLTTLCLDIDLKPPQYYQQTFLPGTKLEISGNASIICQTIKGEITYQMNEIQKFNEEILSFALFQNQTYLFLLKNGQIVDEQQNIYITVKDFNSIDCKLVTNNITISVFCLDTNIQYVIDDKKQIKQFQEKKINDVQVISDQYIILRDQILYLNSVEQIESIKVTVEAFRIVNNTLIFVSNQMKTSEIYIYNFAHSEFEFNRRYYLKSKIENITSLILSSNNVLYISNDNNLIKFDEKEIIYDIKNIKKLYYINEQFILLAISDYGVYVSNSEDISITIPELIPLPIQSIQYYESMLITRQYLYEMQFRQYDPELFCFTQYDKFKGYYEANLLINDKKVEGIKVNIIKPIITSENHYWIWLSLVLFFVGILMLIYCVYGQYQMYMVRFQQITKAKKGAYLKQL